MRPLPPFPDLAVGQDLPHGRLVAVRLPAQLPPEMLETLHPAERALCADFGPLRLRGFVGGRYALRRALADIGAPFAQPILWTSRGAPRLPEGFRGSVSHKDDDIAVALVRPGHLDVGIDVEGRSTRAQDISRKILTQSELGVLATIPEEEQQGRVLLAFSIKEAIYKAVDPTLQRHISFKAVSVNPRTDGSVEVLTDWTDPKVQARWMPWNNHWISTVCVVSGHEIFKKPENPGG